MLENVLIAVEESRLKKARIDLSADRFKMNKEFMQHEMNSDEKHKEKNGKIE